MNRSNNQPDRHSVHKPATQPLKVKNRSAGLAQRVLQWAQLDPHSLSVRDVQVLQRTVGNQEATRLLQPVLQAKLQLGPAGDRYEQEADRVANQVVRSFSATTLPVQRHQEELQAKLLTSTGTPLQRKTFQKPTLRREASHGPEGGEVENSVEQQIQAARGGGKPLDEKVRRPMERGFGTDFSGVRVHTGGQADRLNRSLNARAFTTGKDIFFKRGEYNPGSSGGQKLLAHELTHTVQQGAAGVQRAGIISGMTQYPSLRGEGVVYRQFEEGSDFLKGTTNKNPRFKVIAEAMDAFNKYLNKKSKDSKAIGNAAAKLQLIERTIFAYLDEQNITYEKLEDIPHYAELEKVRLQAGREHQKLVKKAMDENALPFNLNSVPEKDQKNLIKLWGQISQGLGKIQVLGNEPHKQKIYSWLVKLLETPTGRELLGYLNAGDKDEVLTNVYFAETKNQLPKEVLEHSEKSGKELKESHHSEAQPIGAPGELIGPNELKQTDNKDDYLVVISPDDYRKALLQKKKGVLVGGKKYEFNEKMRIGSYVTANEGESENESALHHQIMTPGWVTMGHELGHSAHMRAGGTTMIDTGMGSQGAGIMESVSGENPEQLNAFWQNAEEFFTIKGWENSLRKDVGLTERSSHIPYSAGKKTDRYYGIWTEAQNKFRDWVYWQLKDLNDFREDLKALFNSKDSSSNLESDKEHKKIVERWEKLKNTNFDEQARAYKKEQWIKPKYEEMEKFYKRSSKSYRKKYWSLSKKLSKEEKETWATLKKERNALVKIYKKGNAQIDLNVPHEQSTAANLYDRLNRAATALSKLSRSLAN